MSSNTDTCMFAALRQCVALLPAPNRRLGYWCIPLAVIAVGLEAAAAAAVFALVKVLTGGDLQHTPILGTVLSPLSLVQGQ